MLERGEIRDAVLAALTPEPRGAPALRAAVSRDLGRSVNPGTVYRALEWAAARGCAVETRGRDGGRLWAEPDDALSESNFAGVPAFEPLDLLGVA